jgi:hypothetical protein
MAKALLLRGQTSGRAGRSSTLPEGVYHRSDHESSAHLVGPSIQAAQALPEHFAKEPMQIPSEVADLAGSRNCTHEMSQKGINWAQRQV